MTLTLDPSIIEVLSADCGSRLVLSGVPMIVNHRHNILPDEAGDRFGGIAMEVTLTSDGRRYEGLWHEGPESDETVYVERWGPTGREFHGFIDSVSRRIVQVG